MFEVISERSTRRKLSKAWSKRAISLPVYANDRRYSPRFLCVISNTVFESLCNCVEVKEVNHPPRTTLGDECPASTRCTSYACLLNCYLGLEDDAAFADTPHSPGDNGASNSPTDSEVHWWTSNFNRCPVVCAALNSWVSCCSSASRINSNTASTYLKVSPFPA